MGLSSQLAVSSLARPGVCTSSTRPASPYQGQVIYQTDTNTTLVWNGSGWVLLSTGTANPPGLELVKTQTIGSAVSSVIVSDCFTTSYDEYLITVSDTSTSLDNADFSMQLRTGSTTAATNYYYIYQYITYSGASSTFVAGNNTTTWAFVGRSHNNTVTARIEVSQPRLARRTTVRCHAPGGNIAGPFSGYHDVATAYESVVFSINGTMTGGTIRVYGYRNS